MTTDYRADDGCPEPYLRCIAEAGFTHVHWCQQWASDYIYDESEIDQIACWLKEFDLGLTDLHGSNGIDKRWTSFREYERLAGVELVKNRIAMTARLGSDVVIMHIEPHMGDDIYGSVYWPQLCKSLDELRPFAADHGVRLAIELGDIDPINQVLTYYEPEFIGICYDAGHGNRRPDGPGWLDTHKDRLISVHLHDNDGTGDQHRIPFDGTVDWPRVIGVIGRSSYTKWVNLECSMRHQPEKDEAAFLAHAYRAAAKLDGMLSQARGERH